MPTDLLNTSSLDARDLSKSEFFSKLQGNILKGHGRDNTTHFFVRFLDEEEGQKEKALKWIATFAKEKVTSCKEQLRQRELYNRHKTPGSLFAGIYFTKFFYEFLGEDLNAFTSQAFTAGMKARKTWLHDRDKKLWEEGFQGEIHAMILLAHDDKIELGKGAKEVCDALDPSREEMEKEGKVKFATIVNTEYGTAIRNANGDGLEHFGYVDGISQPLFLKDEVEKYKSEQPFFTANAALRFNPAARLNLVLVPDPFVNDGTNAYGSYFVFRKLEQNVREFNRAEEKLSELLGLKDEDAERAGAMIVGRYEDGTPLTISNDDKMIGSGIVNNFNYKENIEKKGEDNGLRCPFHAHIRKANPRTTEDLDRRMARRGITYGHRNVSTTVDQHFEQMPVDGIGLLFMSFQRSIEDQFEYIQREANNDFFPGDDDNTTGMDLIIGQGRASRKGAYPKNWNDDTELERDTFKSFVTLKGGEYFFAPSIPFLTGLDEATLDTLASKKSRTQEKPRRILRPR